MEVLHEVCKDSRILFRANALSNITDTSFLGKFINKQTRTGEAFRIGRNTYFADSFNNRRTRGKVGRIDFAIIYPIDAIARGNVKKIV